jgi:hypothetical protein
MNIGQRLSSCFKGKAWDYVKTHPGKVGACLAGGILFCSSPLTFLYLNDSY